MRKLGQLFIVFLAIVAAGYLLASEQPAIPFLFRLSSVSVLNDLAIGYLVSLIFWILVVLLPDIQRRRMLRKSLEERYRYFRRGIVGALLSASEGTYDLDKRDKLTEPSEFRRYFSENDDEKWYAALNGLQSQKIHLDELLLEIEIFYEEITYILNNADVMDDEIFGFFKRFSEHIFRLRRDPVNTYDQVKYLGQFVWSIMALWSVIDGQLKQDIVKKMISKI